ncbi:MAG: metallophosphoesterase, partial [Parafilimonas sp.]
MRTWNGWWIVVVVIILIDVYVFFAVKFVSQNNSDKVKLITYSAYWTLSFLAIAFIVLFPYLQFLQTHIVLRNYLFAIVVALFFAKLITSVFLLTDDIRRGVVWLMSMIFPKTGVDFMPESRGGISRSMFLSWTGIALGGTLFTSLIYGFSNKYNYQLKKVRLAFSNLPDAFKGLKIIHISDIHSGSFTDKNAVSRGVEMVLAAKPDLILFTGDLVNDRADEMGNYMDVFTRIKAPMGVYSTFGNHDYGDYVSW